MNETVWLFYYACLLLLACSLVYGAFKTRHLGLIVMLITGFAVGTAKLISIFSFRYLLEHDYLEPGRFVPYANLAPGMLISMLHLVIDAVLYGGWALGVILLAKSK